MHDTRKWWRCKKCGYTTKLYYIPGVDLPGHCTCNAGFHGPFPTKIAAENDKVLHDYAEAFAPIPRALPPERKWWRCKGCGKVGRSRHYSDWNNACCDNDIIWCNECDSETGWHGPFATGQEARDYDAEKYGDVDSLFDGLTVKMRKNLVGGNLSWAAKLASQHIDAIINDEIKKPFYFLANNTSGEGREEKIEMSAIFCDGCRQAFPVEETFAVGILATKQDRNHCDIERHTAGRSHLCDTCFAKLKTEKTVAKLPWETWRKSDDDAKG